MVHRFWLNFTTKIMCHINGVYAVMDISETQDEITR